MNMWYSRKVLGQLNIVGPLQPLPFLPQAPQPQKPLVPIPPIPPVDQDDPLSNYLPEEEPQQEELPIDVEPDRPVLVSDTPRYPMIHENCHCEVKTLPGGRRIWDTGPNPCKQCEQARDEFNNSQSSQFGI